MNFGSLQSQNKCEVNSKQNSTPHNNVWMKITKITRRMVGWRVIIENNSPN